MMDDLKGRLREHAKPQSKHPPKIQALLSDALANIQKLEDEVERLIEMNHALSHDAAMAGADLAIAEAKLSSIAARVERIKEVFLAPDFDDKRYGYVYVVEDELHAITGILMEANDAA